MLLKSKYQKRHFLHEKFFQYSCCKECISGGIIFTLSLADSLQDHCCFLTIMISKLIKSIKTHKIKEKDMEDSPKFQENGPLFKSLSYCKRPHNNNKIPSEKNTVVFP